MILLVLVLNAGTLAAAEEDNKIFRLICTYSYTIDDKSEKSDASGEELFAVLPLNDGQVVVRKQGLGAPFLGRISEEEIAGEATYEVENIKLAESLVVNRFTGQTRGVIMKLSAVRIFVSDVAEAKSFYGDVLGLAVKSDGSAQGYCIFDTGATQFIIETVAPDASQDDQDLLARFTGLSFAVDDIHSQYQNLLARGVEFTGEPELQFWGGWLVTLKDPAGNRVQLV